MTRLMVCALLLAATLSGCGGGTENTDPRNGRVIIHDGGYGIGDDWKICAGPDLIFHFQDIEDRTAKDSAECAA